jgi:putative membrane protein insertion efficiency factor
MGQHRKIVLCSLLALTVYLTGESFLPPAYQPTAQVSLALIHAYQATGSKLMEAGGVRCRYTPTCSHYAEDAIGYYGTVSGVARAAGRVWRCSPWGGTGYDPAVDEHAAAYVAPQQQQQDTPEQRKAREDAQKAAEEFRKGAEEFHKMGQDIQKNAPEALGRAGGACAGACLKVIILLGIHFAVMVACLIFVWKDAKARGDSNATLWLVLVFFLGWVGAVIYLVARPKGDLSPCPSCHQPRLSTLAVCPHCKGGASAPPAPPPQSA